MKKYEDLSMTQEPLKNFIKAIEMKDNRERREEILEQLDSMKCKYEIQTYLFEYADACALPNQENTYILFYVDFKT